MTHGNAIQQRETVSRAVLRYVRITPRKFRQIIPMIKGCRVEEAIAKMASVNKKAAVYAIEVLTSALANARRKQQDIDASTLVVSSILADGGPMLKRFRAASMGRATMIKKRTSHITVELGQVKGPAVPAAVRAKRPIKKKGK